MSLHQHNASFNRYYREELHYLKDLGAEFSRRNPDLGRYLGRESTDPDVERLLEGFAFLTGRLRQKLDDELPELTQSIVNLAAPYLLAPVPATTVVQFEPSVMAARAGRSVPRDAEIGARPVRGSRCRFRTCYEVQLIPAKVVGFKSMHRGGAVCLRLDLLLTHDMELPQTRFRRLRFHLAGGRAPELYAALMTQCVGIRVEDSSDAGFDLETDCLRPVGFSRDEAILPWQPSIPDAFRLLREYFTFPAKFMFVDVCGLEKAATLSGRKLRISFQLSSLEIQGPGIGPDTVRLNATPAVNLFDVHADPIRIENRRRDYRVTARDSAGQPYSVHSLRRVTCDHLVDPGSGPEELAPLHSFPVLGDPGERAWYALRRRPNPATGEVDALISFGLGKRPLLRSDAATVAVAALCTNGRLADMVQPGHVDQMTDGSPGYAAFRDIRPIAPGIPPSLDGTLVRQLLSVLTGNYASWLSVGRLRALMTALNPRRDADHAENLLHARRMEGIDRLDVDAFDWFVGGLPVRGTDITLSLNAEQFGAIGDIYLFSQVLGAFLDDMAPINSVHRLTTVVCNQNRRFASKVRVGQGDMP